jgi:trans-aconitate methyltransferase
VSDPSADRPTTPSRNAWDSSLYDDSFAVITRLGAGVLELLAPRPGERILDLGCGTGALTARIAEAGAAVVGIDASDEMIARARERFPTIEFVVGRGESFAVAEPFDAVFSNAALHWMSPPEAVAARMCAALKPGGRVVAEMGGKGNVGTILDAIRRALGEAGVPSERVPMPWYFPSVGEYATVLERAGLEVRSMLLFDRPTPLDDCPEGVADWIRMFGDDFLAPVPPERRADAARRASALAEPVLKRDGCWLADYRRLRFLAVKP